MILIKRKRKDKSGQEHLLLAMTRKDYALEAEIECQKRLVKSGKQETYDLQPFASYIARLAEIARIANAITAPPSERTYNLATQIGKEVSRLSGVDFITCFEPTKTKRRHISQKLKSYAEKSFEPKLKPTHLTILIVDDIIYTGRTLAETAKALEELGNFVIPVALTYT
ncbi:MAG: hypothetical protein ACK4NX_00975 [Candidatus Paceibacteria bacterium]